MSIFPYVPVESWTPELKAEIPTGDISGAPRELGMFRIYAHRPELAVALMRYINALRQNRLLDDRLVELVRLRVAFHNQCRSCMSERLATDVGVTEDLVCSLEKPYEAPDLSDAEKAALRYADRFATNHLAIDDEMHQALLQHFTVEQVVELGMHCALFVGCGRLGATWNMQEDLSPHFQGDGQKTPWGATSDEVLIVS